MKLSTIHSFKGYESPNIFLFIHEKDSPEIVYTGLTRAKENIVVFIKKGSKYADFCQERLGNIETYLPSSTSNPQSD
ncbi:MAG: ATP-binding domain-containing protein [Dechloromonas sp.]|uniref:ATP-binding domain-containing protein n=1 Tax=Candidatus Dechloromonas phosphorivorans TaxID=2899244 RepID=A0A935JZP7_9RHOO|nr:ATP-binding domain-containing protein [Candidatus Dechloromonas phosphorivorans]